jgi:hypothetical protein
MKKHTCVFLLICLVQINYLYAQTRTIDSLKHLLQTEKQDSTRSILFQLSQSELPKYLSACLVESTTR